MAEAIYSLDLDEELLAHLSDPDAWVVIQGEGINDALIEDEVVAEVFNWQRQHRREHHQLASASVLADEFDLELREPETAIGDLLDRLRERYMTNQGRDALREIVQVQQASPLSVPQELLRRGRELSHLLSKRGEVFGTGDFDRSIRRYDLKAEQGPGASFGHQTLDDHFYGMKGLVFLVAYKKTYKALALDTPIPTPRGWRSMEDLQVGDDVFDEKGRPCRITGTSPTWHQRPCYRVEFSDGTSIVADAEHQWITQTRVPRATQVHTTEEIRNTLRYTQGNNHSLDVNGPLQCSPVELPIDPYVLGAWLGDGTAADAAITTTDQAILESISAAGYTVRKWSSAQYVYGITGGFRTQIREAGLLHHKHIPPIYLRAAYADRLALLQGLLDTDGSCSLRGGIVFVTTNAHLKDGVTELIRSLGFKPMAREYRATLHGRDCGPKWHVAFQAPSSQPMFRLQRKAARQGRFYSHSRRPRSQIRKIIAVEPIDSVPVKCITVDSDSHLFLAGEGMVPTHNSWQMVQCQAANAELGRCTYLYSLELPAEETDMRLRCLLAGIPWWKWVRNAISIEDRKLLRQASEMIDDMGIYRIVKPPSGQRGIHELVHTARDNGADLVLIDQLQYVENDKGKSLGRLNDTGEYFGVLDDARNLSDEGPIYIAHQFGRGAMGAESMPDIALAKGSSAIEEVCTLALGMWANKDMRRSGVVEIGTLIARNASAFGSWEMEVDLTRDCRFQITGPTPEDA